MSTYVMVIGPYDVTVLEFESRDAAEQLVRDARPNFDYYIMTKDELDRNFAQHGALPIISA